jgi:hypothetical protein
MVDIVERMQNYIHGDYDEYVPTVMARAALEIEALRKRIAELLESSSAVERLAVNEHVAGSIPASPATTFNDAQPDKVWFGTDRAALADRMKACAFYDFDSVEMVECKWAMWEEILNALAQPSPAATVEGMTYNTIKAAFDEYHKTLTVMDRPANFDSFSQGYVAGWNAKEAQPHNGLSAGTTEKCNQCVSQMACQQHGCLAHQRCSAANVEVTDDQLEYASELANERREVWSAGNGDAT